MSRYGFETPEEHGPVTWWRGHPVHAVHLLVAALVVSMLVTTALQFARADGVIALLSFSGEAVWRGEVWRVLTYGLMNPPSLGLAIELLMLVWFGREVERFLGRRDFLRLYAGLYLVRPLLFTALAPVVPASFAGGTGSFAVFIAFATLFPDAPLLFNLLARWVAWGLLALGALMALGARDGVRLLELAATSGFAFAFIRHHQGRWNWPRVPRFRRPRPAPSPAPRAAPVPVAARTGVARSTGTTPPVAAPMAEVDALLDKIAQSGIHSLTAAERARLEAAREDLQRRRPKGRRGRAAPLTSCPAPVWSFSPCWPRRCSRPPRPGPTSSSLWPTTSATRISACKAARRSRRRTSTPSHARACAAPTATSPRPTAARRAPAS
jgi:hypothetical protein